MCSVFLTRFIVGKEEIPTHSYVPEGAFVKKEIKIKHCEDITQQMNFIAATKKIVDNMWVQNVYSL